MSTNLINNLLTPVKDKLSPRYEVTTPNTDSKIQRICEVLDLTPGQTIQHNKGGDLSLASILEGGAADVIEKGFKKRLFSLGCTPISSNKKAKEELAKFAATSARNSSCSSIYSPFSINEHRRNIGDRLKLLKSELARGSISNSVIQTVILNQFDEKLGSPKSYCVLDLDHIVKGDVHIKRGLSGKHIYPKDPDIIIEKEFCFNQSISQISWAVPSIKKCKISTCFTESVFGATDGQSDTSEIIKRRLIDAFGCAQETSFTCNPSVGYRGIYEMSIAGEIIYLEILKESAQSHEINTFYPIVFFEHIPDALDNYSVKIASSISIQGIAVNSGSPVQLPYSVFCTIFKNSLNEFLKHHYSSNTNKAPLKPPIRYKSEARNSYILDGALGLKSLGTSVLSGVLTQFFPEGFYAEFESSILNNWLKELISPFDADEIISMQPVRQGNCMKK